MATRSQMAERRHQRILEIRRGEFKYPCKYDHTKPESLPPQPQGHFINEYECGRRYFPTLDEQWPKTIPPGLAPCNLGQFKAQLVRPGQSFVMQAGMCDCYVISEVHRLQLTLAVEKWANSVTPAEFRKIPPEDIGMYWI